MRFYGLHDSDEHEVIEFYATRAAAERELAENFHDEPEWAGRGIA
jgi:hypothetical protein